MKKWLLSLAVVGGVALWVRRKLRPSYEEEWIDSADRGTFGDRGAPAPEQKESVAETRTDITPEQLSMAARIGQSAERITARWPAVSAEDVNGVDGDLDKLANLIAGRAEQPEDEVRKAIEEILAEETPRPSYPAL
jgi:hypothetical protein